MLSISSQKTITALALLLLLYTCVANIESKTTLLMNLSQVQPLSQDILGVLCSVLTVVYSLLCTGPPNAICNTVEYFRSITCRN
ncbi:hypothetical protein RRG08_034900 [Elysia crispata]|uniref:Uncharacterized protein n=1 Tax=Elysia crispata TaxID=231223 RepID=A0AAE0YPL6_9GAST|nr:hypothetical protein RRG08_034900 [Elysia crispata]